MNFPSVENAARELSVLLATEPLPDRVNGLLLSRKNGAVSVVSNKLDPVTANLVHTLNIGSYKAILWGSSDACFPLKYAICLLPEYSGELTELSKEMLLKY